MKQPHPPDPSGAGVAARLEQYVALVHAYHRTLDLMSDAALAALPALIDQARAYADTIERLDADGSVLDVGSGVGLPGVVIACALPHRSVVLVERRRRRAAFLALVVSQLRLSNARVLQRDVTRVEPWEVADGRTLPSQVRWEGRPPGPGRSRSTGPEGRVSAGGVGHRDVPGDASDLGDPSGLGDAGDPSETDDPSEAGAVRNSRDPRVSRAEGRVRSQAAEGGVRFVTAQAVAELRTVYCLTRHLHAGRVVLVSRRGPSWPEEVAGMPAEDGASPAVRAEVDLPEGGTLLAVELRGGLPCPRSG